MRASLSPGILLAQWSSFLIQHKVACKLQALVYDILPSTTAVFSYAIRSTKLSANEQLFVGVQTVVSLLQTTQIKQSVSFITANKVYSSTNKTTIVWIETELGAGIARWLEHRTRDWKVAGSNPCWNGGRIFFSRVDFLCWLLFRYPFHPRVTTVARKKSRSFCQKCRWQVTAKHAYTLRMWILLNRASALVTTCP